VGGQAPLRRWSERSLKFSRILTEKAQFVVTLKPVARKSGSRKGIGSVESGRARVHDWVTA